MTIKNRTDLKSYFVKNAIPTEGNFADLIDSQLNQAQDGVFKPDGEALSVVAAPGDQKRVLRLYANYPAPNPDWMIAVNPAQDPATAGTSRAGFGVTDGAGKTRLFIDAATGRIGVGTNNPQVALDVVGGVQANGFRGRYDLVLNDYRTVNPASNVCLQSPGNDRDTWIYRDAADAGSNWGIYHRQIDAAVAGLPPNSIGFVGGGASKLQAYVNLGDGSGFFAGGLSIQGITDMSATTSTWGGWLEALRFSRPEHSAITHPGGKLLFGMHSDRNFYFGDTSAGRYLAVISPTNGGSLGIGTNGAPERPLHVHSSLADWQAHFQNDSANANVYLAHGGGYGMHVRTDTSAPNNYLLQLYNQTLGGSLFFVSTAGAVGIGAGVTPSTFKLEVHGYSMLTDPAGKYNTHLPFTDNSAYVTGDNVYLRGGQPANYGVILTATASDKSVSIAGNLGTHGFAANSQLPGGWGGGVNTWDVVAHGTVWSVNPYRNGAFDLAERFAHHEDGLEPGDVLAVDPRSPERLIRSRSAQQDDLVGVVSEQPGFILGAQWEAPDAGVSLALAGRVPVKVSLEGGPIRIGDYLTSSSQPGIAMRTIRSGRVIGLAMQAFDGASGPEGKVVVFVNPHWFGGR